MHHNPFEILSAKFIPKMISNGLSSILIQIEFTSDETVRSVEINKIFPFKLITGSENPTCSEMALKWSRMKIN